MGGNGNIDGDSDDDDELIPSRKGGSGRRSKKDEEIVGFGEDGIERYATFETSGQRIYHANPRYLPTSLQKKQPTGPLVIPSLPNRDWRQSSHAIRKPTYIPESQAKREVKKEDLVERSGDEPVKAGLQITSSKEDVGVKQEDVDMTDGSSSVKVEQTEVKIEYEAEVEDSIETRAMKALMMEQNGEEKKNDLVIAMQEDTMDLRNHPEDETDAFRRDVLTRPAESTLDDYAATPIEAFGEALLRGMGWNPDTSKGTKIHVPKRRPDVLGLGATAKAEDTTNGSKLGQKKRPDPSKRAGRGYVPVIRKEREAAGTGSEVSRSGTASRATSRSPDSKDSRDSKRRREDRLVRDRTFAATASLNQSISNRDRAGREPSSRTDYDRADRDRRHYDRDGSDNPRSGFSTPAAEGDRRSDKHRSSRDSDDRRHDRRDYERKDESGRYDSRDRYRDEERPRDRDKRTERH